MIDTTREQWLLEAVEEFKPLFLKNKLQIPVVKVSCGWPSKGGMSKNRTLGECFPSTATFDGTIHIFITPMHGEAVEALGTLAHELVHASLPDDVDSGKAHGPNFKEAAKSVGLTEGRPKSVGPGLEMMPLIEAIAEKLGKFPNPAIKPKEDKPRKAQSKKSFKMFCPDKRGCTKKCLLLDKAIEEDYTVTAGKKALKLGMPHCPCGSEMEMEAEDYELYKLVVLE